MSNGLTMKWRPIVLFGDFVCSGIPKREVNGAVDIELSVFKILVETYNRSLLQLVGLTKNCIIITIIIYYLRTIKTVIYICSGILTRKLEIGVEVAVVSSETNAYVMTI